MIIDIQSYLALRSLLVLLPAIIVVFTVRGFARSLAAKWQGDYTAENYGFLTLNPAAHVDAISCIVIVIMIVLAELLIQNKIASQIFLITFIILFGGRLLKQTPLNPHNFKDGLKSAAKIALAGPVSNLLLSLVCFYVVAGTKYLSLQPYLINTINDFAIFTGQISVFFAAVEMLPIPPLDGFKIFEYFYPHTADNWAEILGPWAPFLVLACIFLPGLNIFLSILTLLFSLVIKLFVFI